MSLHDEHLQQALKQAPDSDLAPSDAVREKVFAHVESAMQPKSNRLVRWFSDLGRIQLVGISSIATAVIVMLMVYPQAPDDAVWSGAEEADIALSDNMSEDKELAASAELQNLEPEQPASEPEEEAASPVDANRMAKKLEKSAKPLPKKAKQQIELPETISDDMAEDIVHMESDLADAQESVEVEIHDKEIQESIPMATAPKPQESRKRQAKAGVLEAFSSKRSLTQQNLSATQLAQEDIASGRLRILLAEDHWPEHQVMVDEETGYNIELSSMSAQDVEAYNEIVRNWYRENLRRR